MSTTKWVVLVAIMAIVGIWGLRVLSLTPNRTMTDRLLIRLGPAALLGPVIFTCRGSWQHKWIVTDSEGAVRQVGPVVWECEGTWFRVNISGVPV